MLAFSSPLKAGSASGPLRPRVALPDVFTDDNDPNGEHDFGSIVHQGKQVFWKIDYSAPDMEHGSEDPSAPAKTVRVLTIMLSDEY